MPRKGYKTTSYNIENHLYALAVEDGLNLSAFFNRCLAIFYEVPEDPRDKLVKEKTQYTVLRLKEKYKREIMEVIKEYESQNTITNAVQDRENELILFGQYLQKTSAFPVFKRCLKTHDFDDDTLQIVTSEINKMNGQRYDTTELWNKAIDWYRKYGEATG